MYFFKDGVTSSTEIIVFVNVMRLLLYLNGENSCNFNVTKLTWQILRVLGTDSVTLIFSQKVREVCDTAKLQHPRYEARRIKTCSISLSITKMDLCVNVLLWQLWRGKLEGCAAPWADLISATNTKSWDWISLRIT